LLDEEAGDGLGDGGLGGVGGVGEGGGFAGKRSVALGRESGALSRPLLPENVAILGLTPSGSPLLSTFGCSDFAFSSVTTKLPLPITSCALPSVSFNEKLIPIECVPVSTKEA
jgi:hypothetical protein